MSASATGSDMRANKVSSGEQKQSSQLDEVDGLVAAGKYREALSMLQTLGESILVKRSVVAEKYRESLSMLQALEESILVKRAACIEGLITLVPIESTIVASTIASMACCIFFGNNVRPFLTLLWPQCVSDVLER